MKSFKRVVAFVLSLVMVLSCMTVSVSANSPTGDSIAGAKVTVKSVYYTGKKQKAKSITVTLDGKKLTAGTEYKVTVNKGGRSTGSYKVVIEGVGKYSGTVTGTFTIKAARKPSQTTKVKATTKKTVKAKKYKNRARRVTLTFKSSNNKSKPVITVKGGNRKTRKAIKTSYKKGKIYVTMPKGAKPGTYKIVVKLPAYNKCKRLTKTLVIKVTR